MKIKVSYLHNRSEPLVRYQAYARYGFLHLKYCCGFSAQSFGDAKRRLLDNLVAERNKRRGVPTDETVEV